MSRFDGFKTKDIDEPTEMEIKLTRLVAKKDNEIIKLEEVLEEKNKMIEELEKLREVPSALMSREDLKGVIVTRIKEVYPGVTTGYAVSLLEEVIKDLVSESAKNYIVK